MHQPTVQNDHRLSVKAMTTVESHDIHFFKLNSLSPDILEVVDIVDETIFVTEFHTETPGNLGHV